VEDKLKRLSLLVLLFWLSACGDDAEELTCQMLEDPNFCWNARVAEAQSCTAELEETAISDDDGLTCVYPEGDVVANFNRQISSEGDFSELELDFNVEVDGEFCMAYREGSDDQVLETPSGSARLGAGGTTLVVECGGTTYEASGFALLDECGFGGLPGHSWSKSSFGFFINLLPDLDDEPGQLIECDYARDEMPAN